MAARRREGGARTLTRTLALTLALALALALTLTLTKAVLALSRGAVVSSMCWLRRLSETKKRRTYGEGEVQAMDWGLTQCGRDVTEIGRHVLPSP